jgi:hypothetical protein
VDKVLEKLSPDFVFAILVFLVPGYILRATLGHFTHRRGETDNKTLLEILAFSAVNWLPLLVWWSFSNRVPKVHDPGEFWTLIVFILLMPMVLALILAIPLQKGWLPKVGGWLRLNTRHESPTAWDYVFQEVAKDPVWVMVRLKEDRGVISGLMANKSLAASDPGERDLYLEQVYIVDEATDEWTLRDRSRGMLIKADEIALIEFLD